MREAAVAAFVPVSAGYGAADPAFDSDPTGGIDRHGCATCRLLLLPPAAGAERPDRAEARSAFRRDGHLRAAQLPKRTRASRVPGPSAATGRFPALCPLRAGSPSWRPRPPALASRRSVGRKTKRGGRTPPFQSIYPPSMKGIRDQERRAARPARRLLGKGKSRIRRGLRHSTRSHRGNTSRFVKRGQWTANNGPMRQRPKVATYP